MTNRFPRKPRPPRSLVRAASSPALLWSLAAVCVAISVSIAQPSRMAIEVSVQLDGNAVPQGTVVRVLRADGSVVRTITPYSANPSQFAVRLGSTESLREGEPLAFRVVLSRRDSFEARIAGPPLAFRGKPLQEVSVTRIVLFRNHLPSIRRFFPDTTILERQPLRLRVWATDEDGDTLRYRLVEGPPGATVEPWTGYVTYVPGYDDAGTYPVEIAVSDGREEVRTRKAVLRVIHVNRPPRVERSVPNRTVAEGDLLTIAVAGGDPDLDSLAYSLVESAYRFRLFSRNGVFEWTPGYDAAGRYRCFVTVTDGSITDTSNVFEIEVLATNRPPAFARQLVDTAVLEQEPLALNLQAFDPDGDSVRYNIELAPEGVSMSTSGMVVWTPTYEQSGSYVIVISAADSSRSSEAVVRITVLDRNRGPLYGEPSPTRDTVRVPFGRLVELNWHAAKDPDQEDTLRYTLRLWGVDMDTSIVGIMDTSLSLFMRGRLMAENVYAWTTSVTDGLAEASSPDTFAFRLVTLPVSVTPAREPAPVPPRMFTLEQVGSHPSGSLTIIRYALTHRSAVDIALYSMLGERRETIFTGERVPGQYETTFDASRLSGGVYMFKLEAHPLDNAQVRDFVSTKKMVLVK